MISSRPGRPALVLLAALLGGCVGSAPTTSNRASEPPPPTASPATTLAPTASPPTPATGSPEPTLQPPPAATLVAGGAEAIGRVGSYVWAGGSDAAPWFPATALHPVQVDAGSEATVALAPDVDVASWTARSAAADDPTAETVTPLGSGAGRPAFPVPATGDWVVSLEVSFGGGLGDATWYWHLIVE